jgi:hypothetical protein
MKGKWRIIKMPDYTSDYPDMVEPAYISFDGKGGGQFTFGCVTWTTPAVMDGPNSSAMAPSKDKSASTAEIKPTSLRGHGRLLQQPASLTESESRG